MASLGFFKKKRGVYRSTAAGFRKKYARLVRDDQRSRRRYVRFATGFNRDQAPGDSRRGVRRGFFLFDFLPRSPDTRAVGSRCDDVRNRGSRDAGEKRLAHADDRGAALPRKADPDGLAGGGGLRRGGR